MYGAVQEFVDDVRGGCEEQCLDVKKASSDVREGVRNCMGVCGRV